MNAEITTIQITQVNNSLDPVRTFGVLLNNNLTVYRMGCWNATDYQTRAILQESQAALQEQFDRLFMEVLSSSYENGQSFPSFGQTVGIDCCDISNYSDNKAIINAVQTSSDGVRSYLSSLEFNTYMDGVQSGLRTVRDEIFSTFNKTNHLLSMVGSSLV